MALGSCWEGDVLQASDQRFCGQNKTIASDNLPHLHLRYNCLIVKFLQESSLEAPSSCR